MNATLLSLHVVDVALAVLLVAGLFRSVDHRVPFGVALASLAATAFFTAFYPDSLHNLSLEFANTTYYALVVGLVILARSHASTSVDAKE